MALLRERRCGEVDSFMALVFKEYEPLAPHAVFKIGGPARFFVETHSAQNLIAAISLAAGKNLPWLILGAGSNVLISDDGFPGMVIHPRGGKIALNRTKLQVDSGVSMARAVAEALKHGLRGFEWACGIPGTIGGSIRGNAGCFGSEMKDVVAAIEVFNAQSGKIEEWTKEKASFYYRDSIFKKRPELVVLSARLDLKAGNRKEGQSLVRGYLAERSKTQDIGSQSAGCIFKNIPWNRRDVKKEESLDRFPELRQFGSGPAIPAGFLIDQVDLKGRGIGSAAISEHHANFIVNRGGATAEEVIMLIGVAKEYVHRRYGFLLEEEIQYIGFAER